MEIELTIQAKEDLSYWKKTNNILVLKKIRALLTNIIATPCSGIGKPEALKHDLSGKWSSRITKSDRLVYKVVENKIHIYSLKDHYNSD